MLSIILGWIRLHQILVIGITGGAIIAGGVSAVLINQNNSPNLSPTTPTITPSAFSESPINKASPTPTATPTATAVKPTTQPTAAPTATTTTTPTATTTTSATPSHQPSTATTIWTHNGTTWSVNGTPPSCPNPFTFTSPVDLTLATSILYPGQVRGNDYKPHGGFRFDNTSDGTITVRAPYSGVIVQASRYIESGEVQYLFEFQNSCGIAWRFDHLKTLSTTMQAVADKLPEAKVDDSRTTPVSPPVTIDSGATLATNIGESNNTFVDWGVYDLRNHNGITKSNNTLASYGVCWFDWLSASDEATVRALPATADNKTSDYCQ